jgi:hypothetical protein
MTPIEQARAVAKLTKAAGEMDDRLTALEDCIGRDFIEAFRRQTERKAREAKAS